MGRESRVERESPKSVKAERKVYLWNRKDVEYLPVVMRALGTKRSGKTRVSPPVAVIPQEEVENGSI